MESLKKPCSHGKWSLVISDRFQEGNVFLVGDAARAQPPTRALGGNTGIAEAHNLAWKLAAVLRGEANLDTDLFGSKFVLLVGPEGQNWLEAARRTSDTLSGHLDIYQIGMDAGDLLDAGNKFCKKYEITPTGALLVRSDGIIGWRMQPKGARDQDNEQALAHAFSTILFR